MKSVRICVVLFIMILLTSCTHKESFEESIKKEYGFYEVEKMFVKGAYTICYSLSLNDSDFGRYYETKQGEAFLDRVIPEIIVRINEDREVLNELICEAKEKGYKKLRIEIHIRQKDEFMNSSMRKVVGRYYSVLYPIDDWFTDRNKQEQEWIRYVGTEEKGRYKYLDIKRKGLEGN